MILNDSKGDRAARERAYALADSGRFSAVRDVEAALIGEGWSNARAALQSDFARKAILDRCLAAQAH